MSYKDYDAHLQFLRIIAMEGAMRKGYVQRVSPTKGTVTLTQDITKAKKCRTKYEVEKAIDQCMKLNPRYVYEYGLS